METNERRTPPNERRLPARRPKVQISVRIDPETLEAARWFAADQERTMSSLFSHALKTYLRRNKAFEKMHGELTDEPYDDGPSDAHTGPWTNAKPSEGDYTQSEKTNAEATRQHADGENEPTLEEGRP